MGTPSVRSQNFRRVTSSHEGRTVLDGEIVCLDKKGRPQFRDLLFHRGQPFFFAFDLLMADGKDLRTERLTDRKQEMRRMLAKATESGVRYVEHVERHGKTLFQRVCEMDLEGIVAPSTVTDLTSQSRSERRGSRFAIGTIRNGRDGKNSSSGSDIKNLFPAGTRAM
jgi:ATP-dependent DNA ligase